MNGLILLIPALTVGQVDAAWATRDNVDKEWVLRIEPQVLDWLREGKYKEVASNIADREPGASRLRIRFAKADTPANPNAEVLTSQNTAEITANWQKTVDEQTKAEVREFVVQITPGLIRTLQTGRYEILETIPVQAGAVRHFRLVVVDPAIASQPVPPVALPGTQPGVQPGTQPGVQPVTQPGVHPVTQPGVPPIANPATNPNAPIGQPPVASTAAPPVATNPATPFTPRPPSPLGAITNVGQVANGQAPAANAAPFQPAVPGGSSTLPQTPVGQSNFVTHLNPQLANANHPTATNPNFRPGTQYAPSAGAHQQPYAAPVGVNYGTAPHYQQQYGHANAMNHPNYAAPGAQPQVAGGYQRPGWQTAQTPLPPQTPVRNYPQTSYAPAGQVQVAQAPVGQPGYAPQQTAPVAPAKTENLPNYATTTAGQEKPATSERAGEGEAVNQVSREAAGNVPAATQESTTDFFWLMIFLFLSIGFNIYLVWVAWQTYWKYRDLVSDTRGPRPAGAEGY